MQDFALLSNLGALISQAGHSQNKFAREKIAREIKELAITAVADTWGVIAPFP